MRRSLVVCLLAMLAACVLHAAAVEAQARPVRSARSTAGAGAVSAALAVLSLVDCPNQCTSNQHGECMQGVCVCRRGFSGPDCSVACPNLCSGNGECSNGRCVCAPGYLDSDCSIAAQCPRSQTDHPELECSGHGVCDRPTQTCVCRQGYVGKDCSIDDGSCGAMRCSNHGHCVSGVCQCDLGYSGEHCEIKTLCPADCSGKGMCIGGTCHCYPGFVGEECSKREETQCTGPDGGCNGNGVCSGAKCICSVGFSGEACESLVDITTQPFCAAGNDCSGNGVCKHNQCFCRPGFYGAKCESQGCASGCGEHGHCSMGQCRCQPGWSGPDCTVKTACPNGCSGHGACDKGKCVCEAHYAGEDCSKLTLAPLPCPKVNGKDCAGNGLCFLGQCFCEPSFTGHNCTELVANCPANCGGSSRGTCRFGQCFCEAGFEGESCEITKKCPKDCSNNGICIKGECKCAIGFKGDTCSETMTALERQRHLERDLLNSVLSLSGPSSNSSARASCGTLGKPCSEHGLCISGTCACEAGWGGLDCSLLLHAAAGADCGAQACSGNGDCVFGSCVCLPGFGGKHCEQSRFLPCPADCSQRGICHLGACQCHPGFEGADCATVSPCKAGCVHGACVQGQCECVYGYRGADCNEAIPANALPPRDDLEPLGLRSCGPSACGKHGVCVRSLCVCVEGYTGGDCDVPIFGWKPRPADEPTPANEDVSDIFGTQSCKINCGLHGVCIGGSCTCVDGWAGEKCNVHVGEIHTKKSVASPDDFLAILTLQKGTGEVQAPPPTAQAKPQTPAPAPSTASPVAVSLLESHSSGNDNEKEEEERPAPRFHRQTALLSPSASLAYSPDAAVTDGADPAVLAPAPNQVSMQRSMASEPPAARYSMSISPYLMSFLCFTTGLLVTLSLKCLLDKRDQEKRKMKKIEELLFTPAS